ncbi:MAG: SH3 domain-containing protein [Spirochaetaceae bacterium]|nr:SH3 domain-containing protein [Spirochaetaceae bacterium]
MKKLLLLIFVGSLVFFSCLGKEEEEQVEIPAVEEESISCFSIYPGDGTLGVRVAAGQDQERAYYLSFLEEVTWTGNSKEIGNYTWLEIINEEGERGWCWEIYLPADAQPAIMTDDMLIYEKPELGAVTANTIKTKQFLAITGTEGIFYEIRWVTASDKKYHDGFIKKDNISSGNQALEDLQVINLIEKAQTINNVDVAKEIINDALTFRNSAFYQEARLVADQLANPVVEEAVALALGASVKITRDGVNMRSAADTASEEITMLNSGTEGIISAISPEAETIGSYGSNFWYKLTLEDQSEGWIYGAFVE